MKARALICDESQNFSIEEVVLLAPAADQVVVGMHYTGISIGTEFALVRRKISWGPYPLCTGYMGTGVVEAVGADIKNLRVGDSVYVRRNDGMKLAGGGPVSCVSGVHCTHVVTKTGGTHGAAKVFPGAAMDVASMFVIPAVGFYGVSMADPGIGHKVVVYGTGQIGAAVVAACALRGCEVIAIDVNEVRLGIARDMGADHLINAAMQDVEQEVKRLASEGADAVFECTGLPECVDPAIALCRKHGRFIWQGNYGAAHISLHFLPAHGRQLRMFFPCDDGYGPCRRAVMKNMAAGALKWEKCITHRISCAEAPAMFERINKGQDSDIMGVVIDWRD
jgi:2-desacetyl-2-hydroxyethyl bacteriochlorophyllide A dehydrogenase